MSIENNKILAVIPARGGSKAIPNKNLCKLSGRSLVGRACMVAKSIDWIDQTIVSTDSKAIRDEALKFGAEAPFLRPEHLASDKANSIDMWIHALQSAEQFYQMQFDITLLLEPTSPLRTISDIKKTVEILLNGGAAAATVSPTPAHFTPHKTLTIEDGGIIGFYLKEGPAFSIRQDIPKYYHRNGICYALRRETLLENNTIIEENCAAVIIDRPIVNIDEPFELELAEWLLSRQRI